MNFLMSFLLVIFFGIVNAGVIPNPEHPDKLMTRHMTFNYKLNPDEKTKDFWINKGKTFIENQINIIKNEKQAKNVIFFIGDGMSLTTLAASRVYQGGEEIPLSFEKFPYTGLAKTYSVDKIVPDSASTATAYLCGVKANYGTIGVNAKVARKDCSGTLNKENYTPSIGKWALEANKLIGLVTTTRVTHASPAGLYANVADRNWENDVEVEKACGNNKDIKDIAQQLINGDIGKEMTVIMGGGRREFRNESIQDEEGLKNKRKDGKDLIKEWQQEGIKLNENRQFIYNREQLLNLKPESTDRLLGLFKDGHMNYRMEAPETQPTLVEMTEKAIKILQHKSGDKGYFLFVEGGLIDVAHHDTYANIAFNETIEFSKAIEKARNITSEEDTLIVVSSDHSHTMTMAGYPDRFNSIFGVAGESDSDYLPFLTINYANGGAANDFINLTTNKRFNPKKIIDEIKPRTRFPATHTLKTETHGGEDVAVFASGPWAHLFTGVYEQSTLPHMMAYSACIGEGLTAC